MNKPVSYQDYIKLKKEVDELYAKMMEMHQEQRRDALYANARARYMEKKNLLQKILQENPELNG